jgi:hypothetical protein
MKPTLTFFCLLSVLTLAAQDAGRLRILDTILIEQFMVDPTENMLPVPSGNDTEWVNFDADGLSALCADGPDSPSGWYFESDLGDLTQVNSAYTSCSFHSETAIEGFPSANWLILPPITIVDTTTTLEWKSLSFNGPAFVDGYKVLVSTTGNDPYEGAFTDTLFRAAEMIRDLSGNYVSLNPNSYLYSQGYVHANRYTLQDYFFLVPGEPFVSAPFYHGLMEPHAVSLKQYNGQQIYIAFLHDSDNDFILQIDDILVAHDKTSGTQAPAIFNNFTISPNPARGLTNISWTLTEAQPTVLRIYDALGRITHTKTFLEADTQQQVLDFQGYVAGLYAVELWTPQGVATRRVVVE